MFNPKIIQLDLFQTEYETRNRYEINDLRIQCKETKDSLNKCRKKLFAENGELKKKVNDLEERLMIMERNICRGIC